MVTDGSGNVVARQDYLPFGEEIPAGYAGRSSSLLFGSSDGVEQKFTGQIRDSETGMDFFPKRYYASAVGRFTSPDPMNLGADLLDPQSWNAYAYVRNNPLALVDPMGLCTFDAEGNAVEDENGACYEGGFGGSVTVVAQAPPDVMPIFVSLPSLASDTQQPAPTAPPPAVREAGVLAQPPKNGFQNNKQIQACLSDYYGSKFGKAVDFFSTLGLVPGWSPNATENLKEIGTLTLGKYVGLKGLQTAANKLDTQEITSIFGNTTKIPSSAAAGLDVGLHALGKAGMAATAFATTIDVMAHYTCAMTAYPTASVPSPF